MAIRIPTFPRPRIPTALATLPPYIICSVILFVLIIILFATTVTTTLTSHYSRESARHDANLPPCVVEGNQDMYGLGVRLGVYLQIFTTTFVDSFSTPMHAASIAPANIWFLIALFLALSTYAWESKFPAAEGYILLSLGNGITLTILGGATKLNPSVMTEACSASFARYAIWAMWKIFSASFWWQLLPAAEQNACNDGVTWGWLFVRLDLMGWFRVFHKVLNVLEWFVWFGTFIPYPVAMIAFAVWLWKLDTTDWGVGKAGILVDYAYVSTGRMHDIAFGESEAAVWEPEERALEEQEEEKETITLNTRKSWLDNPIPDLIRDFRIIEHRFYTDLYARYGISPELQRRRHPLSPEELRHRTNSFVWWFRGVVVEKVGAAGMEKFPFLFFWDFVVLCVTVCTAELSVILNGVTEVGYVGTAGQLVAFICGLGGLVSAVGSFWVDERERRRCLKEM